MAKSSSDRKKITTMTFQKKKERGEPITMLTAYDYPTAMAVDRADIDAILVGDSLAMVVLGYENTIPVTMEMMLHHCRAVARGAHHPLLVGDMPFMAYQISVEEAVRNAGRFLQEAGMDAVKLEGGRERIEATKAIVAAGIPVFEPEPTRSSPRICDSRTASARATCGSSSRNRSMRSTA